MTGSARRTASASAFSAFGPAPGQNPGGLGPATSPGVKGVSGFPLGFGDTWACCDARSMPRTKPFRNAEAQPMTSVNRTQTTGANIKPNGPRRSCQRLTAK